MTIYLQVLSVKSVSVHEETLIGIGALANAIEGDFEKFLPHFSQFLLFGLRNWQEYEVCSICVGVVGDIARAVHQQLAPYTDAIVNALLEDLKNPELNRNVKPPILSAFGDIALALSGGFEKYLTIIITVLQHASLTALTDRDDEDLIDYINTLRESIFDAYTGILQGLKSDDKAGLMIDHAKPIVDFAEAVLRDDVSSELVTRAAIGVLGDLVHCLQGRVGTPQLILRDGLKQLVSKHTKSDAQSIRQVANWTLSLLNGLKR
jgi:importin subunit beta-1